MDFGVVHELDPRRRRLELSGGRGPREILEAMDPGRHARRVGHHPIVVPLDFDRREDAGRRRETGIRLALGGGRWDIARPLLLEGVVLALASIVCGIMVAKWLLPALLALAPGADDSWSRNLKLSWQAIGFLAGLGLFTGVIIASGPAWRAAHLNVNDTMKEGGAAMGESRRLRTMRGALVVLEAALAVALLTGAGLMVRTFLAIRDVPPGFRNPESVLTFRISIPTAVVGDLDQVARMHEEIARRLEAVAGVDSVGLTSSVTMDGNDNNDPIWVEDVPQADERIPALRRMKYLGARYFETMGNPIIAGRDFTWADVHTAAPVAILSENLAR